VKLQQERKTILSSGGKQHLYACLNLGNLR
jgi:hypothetical protein